MNLIVNPGFQTGTFASWINAGCSVVANGRPVGPAPYYAASFGIPGPPFNFFSQNMILSASTLYYFTFWMRCWQNTFDFVSISFSTNNGQPVLVTQAPTVADGWVSYHYTFTTNPGVVNGTVSFTGQGTSPSFYVDDVWVSTSPVCYPAETPIKVRQISTNEVLDLPVRDIRTTEHLVINSDGEEIPISKIVVCRNANRLMSIDDGKLLLTGGHRILHEGEMIKARDYPNKKRIKCKSCEVYSIICPTAQRICSGNHVIGAYSIDDWEQISSTVVHTERE